MTKIAIVGAGIIGVNCAIALAEKGLQVTVFDPAGTGEKCSKANAGHFATEQVFPLSNTNILKQLPQLLFASNSPLSIKPSYFLKAFPWFMRFTMNAFEPKQTHNIAALQALNLNAIDCYKTLLKKANALHLLNCDGSLLVYQQQNTKQAQLDYERFQQAGVAVKLLDKTAVHQLEPELADNIATALYFTEVGHTIDPLALTKALAEYASNLTVSFKQHAVTNIISNKDGVKIHTTNGDYQFDQLLITAGAYSKTLVESLGYKLPIEAERGYSYTLPQSNGLTRPVTSFEHKFIITPMAQGLRFAGTTEFAGINAKANYKRANMLFEQAKQLLPKLNTSQSIQTENAQLWMGARPSLPDSLPVLDKVGKHHNIFLATGHQHLGLTLGAKTGEIMAKRITNEKTNIDLKPYSLDRFQ